MANRRSPRSNGERPSRPTSAEGRRRGPSRTNRPLLRSGARPRKLAIETLESRTLLSADVGLRYQFELNGVPVTSLTVGNTYTLNAYIRDNRGAAATGVLQAYFDLDYSASLVSVPSGQAVTAGPEYDWANGGNVSTAGEIIGAGGESTYRVPPSPTDEEQLLFSVPLYANNAGTLTLSTLVDTSSGNTIITMFPTSMPPTISSMSDVEVDGLNATTLSPSGSTVTGTIPILPASAGTATHFVVSAPASATAGSPVNITVTAEDAFGNLAAGYAGTVHFTSSDAAAVLPANATLTDGVGTFTVTFDSAGNQTVTATDAASATIVGSSGATKVTAAAATHFVLSAPTSATAGSSITLTATAKDAYGNVATGYAGTIHFTSSDPQAALPPNASLSNGTGTFSVTLKTAGGQIVTATDTGNSSLTGSSATTNVTAAAATHLAVSAPASATAGSAFTFTVTAQDAYNNTAASYAGTVHFTSSDAAAVLPLNATLTNGVGTFSATMKTAGTRTLTATDIASSSITGTSAAINVNAAAATHFTVSAPASTTAGSAVSVTVTALDAYGNVATGYGGTVQFSSSDTAAVLPANANLTNGAGTFSVTLKTVGSRTVTVTDTSSGSITGVSSGTKVNAAAATHLAIASSGSAVAGAALSFTVTALDAYNNTATGYTGTVHFTSSDPAAVLSANSTLSSGAGTFSVTFKTSGSQTITATDFSTSSITGSGAVSVSPAAATHFVVSAPSAATAGSPVTFTVTALDAYSNIATGYAGTVHFTSTDPAAVLPANTKLTNGASTFSATLETSGSRTITATDTATSSITGSSGSVNVSPAAATHFTVSAPATATAGTALTLTVTAKDAYNNTVTGYSGTVHFSSGDAAAVLPANSTLGNGVGIFSFTLKTAGSQFIIATDSSNSSLAGSSSAVSVSPAAATHFVVTAGASATAGGSFTITVVAQDAYNNRATGYAGVVRFSSSDSAAVLPANSALPGGLATFSITLKTAGSQTITATDTSSSSITGSSGAVTVAAGAATHFVVGAPSTDTAGNPVNITVTAKDAYNNTASSYAGTVHFSSSDPAAVLPANATLTGGAGSFTATLETAGNQTLTAADTANGSLAGVSGSVNVTPAAATHFVLSAPASSVAGSAVSFTLTAKDAYNNTVTGYAGTVHFTSSDPAAVLPANATLSNGAGTFSATLKTAGGQTLTAADTVNGSIAGSGTVTVSAAAVAHLAVSAPAGAVAGSPVTFTVTAQDTYNNTVASYTGTVHFSSSDAAAVLPANATLSNGTGTFSATLKTAGSQTLKATDTVNSSLTGSSPAVLVSAAAATHLVVAAPTMSTAGGVITVTVTAQDAYGNKAAAYAGTVQFTSSDAAAVLPGNSSLTNGVGTFSVTLKTAGSQTITATDTANGSLTGSSGAVSVSAAAAAHFSVSAPASALTGVPLTFTVTAQDAYGNKAASYTGTVHFSSSDTAAVLPANTTLTSGTGTFSVTLKTAGSQALTATDTLNASMTGSSAAVSVVAAPATHFVVSAPASATAGSAITFTVTAKDVNNNTATAYAGTIQFTSSDAAAGLPTNATLTNGVGTFTVTLKTAGSQTITVTDTAIGALTGTSGTVSVSAAAASHFVVVAPASATAGSAVTITVTAEDAYNNKATTYTGTVHFTSSDAAAVLPANSALSGGSGTFAVTLKTAGNQTISVADTTTASIAGSSGTVNVSPAAASHFLVSAPASATTGIAISVTVTAKDAYNNTVAGYAGTLHFTSSDAAAILPANSTLTNGTGTFSVTLKTGGNQTITATDTATTSLTGSSSAVSVSLAPATHFVVACAASATAGGAITVTVTAKDANNNTASGYTGTVHFTSSDPAAVLPANATLTGGVGTFTVTLKTSGSQTITATDSANGSLTGTTGTVSVSPAAATHFVLGSPAGAAASIGFTITVTAEDAYNNTVTGYAGTVHFSSSDAAAVLPANSTLTKGTGTFGVTLKTGGSQTVTATDTANSSLTGTSTLSVAVSAATHFVVTAPASATAGGAVTFTVTAKDVDNNTATGYTGTVQFTSSDPAAVLPANATLTNGVGTFSVTLKTAGSQTIAAADTVTSSLAGSSGAVSVSAAAASRFVVSAPTTATAGGAVSLTITAQDAYNNTATGYTGTVHFTSSDAAAVLPANATLSNGTGTFSVTLKTAGNQTITATDSANGSLTGNSGPVSVGPAVATHFAVSAPATAVAGVAVNVTITAEDAYNNTATGYTGTVHFSSSDAAAVLPANTTLTGGTGSFTATLNTVGSQTLKAADTTNSALTGSATVNVTAAAASHFVVSAPASATAGSVITFTVTAKDASNNTATGYTGTVQFSCSDPAAVLPSNATLTNGVGTFSVTLKTAGSQTVTATDTAIGSLTGSSPVVVNAAAVTHLAVALPATATAGSAFSFTVTAEDAYNNPVPGYAGTVRFASSDPTAVLPANTALTGGSGTFNATLETATQGVPGQTITATDISSATITGSSAVNISAAAATHFVVSAPSAATAGSAFVFTVTAQDAYGNTATGYAGTVAFTSTDPAATLPANATLTGGTATFSATFQTNGSQTLTATDTVNGSLAGSSGAVNVTLPATHFVLTVPATATVGAAFNIRVTAEDVNNNTAAGYTGTVHFTSSDAAAVLPANATLSNGVGTFSVTLNTAGNQTLTATDTLNGGLAGSSTPVSVAAASGATHFVVIAARSATAGKSINFTVTAESSSGATATGYTGTVQFSSSDPAAVLPASGKLINGSATFTITLKTAGSQTITATDTANSSLSGTSGAVSVTAAAASQFVLGGVPSSSVAGSPFAFTVTAEDAYGNPATSYTGSVHFSSSDTAAVLPGNTTLSGGTGSFAATLNTLGSQTLKVADTTNSALTGSATVNVTTAAGPIVPAASFAFAPMVMAADDSSGPPASGYPAAAVDAVTPDSSAGSNPPSVIMQTPPTTVFGNIIISYDLIDANRDACSIQVQFSPDGGITWASATAAPGGDGTQNLPSGIGPTGYAHEYMWASGVDIGNVYNSDVEIRITPVDSVTGAQGATASTAGFSVNNTQLPDLVISGAPASVTAGASFNLVVTEKNQSGTIVSSTDPLQFYSSDTAAVLPSGVSLAGGAGSFSATLNTPGAQWIAVDDSTTGAAAKVDIDTLTAASQLGFTTSPQTLTAGSTSGTITIALENASGNPVNAVNPVTVNLSSTSAAGTFTPSSLTIPAGASTVSFQYSDTAAGTPTLTAAASGLASATQQETVVAAAPTHAVFSTAAQTLTAGIASGTITVALEDAYGNPTVANGSLAVVLTTTSSTGSFTPASPLTIPAGEGSVSFQYSDTTAGTPTLTATAGSLASAAQQETVEPAAASQLAFTTAPQTLTAGIASGTITVALEDAFGNPTDTSGALTVNLSTTSSNGTFSPASPLTIAAGANSASFQYTDTSVGSPTLTATAGTLAAATQQEAVKPAAASHLAFTTLPQTLTAGIASGTITVALEDAFGNPVAAGSALTVTLSTSSGKGTFSPALSLTIAAGASTVSFEYMDTSSGTPALTAAAGSFASATQHETVNPAAASQLAFTTSPQTLTAGTAGGTMVVALEDAFGNPVGASGPLTVTLSTTSGEGTFIPASPLTISAGAGTVSFQYQDTAAGTPSITAAGYPLAGGSFSSATQRETVLPAAASQLDFTTAEQILTAGTPSQTMIVDLADAFGNPVDAGSNLALSLTTTSYAGQFIDGNGNVLPYPAPLTIVAGASAVSFQYADTAAGAPTITATAAGFTSATQLETVVAAPASQLDFTTAQQVLTAGVASQAMTVELDDAFGNPVAVSTPLTVSVNTTSAAGTFAPLSPLTILAGNSTVSFLYTDTAAGAPTITATAASFGPAVQQETVVAAAASQLAFITAAQTLTAATPSQTMTVQLEDAFGNSVDASTPLSVSLSTTSVAGTFAPTSPLTIPADGDTASFSYTDTLAGTPKVTAAAAGLVSATQVETVDPAAASQLTFTTAPQTLTAGTGSGTITLTLEDASGNVAGATSAVTINLNTTSSKGTFTPSALTIPAGSSSVSFHYKDVTAGTPTITATASSGATQWSATQQETVVPSAASQLVFTTPPQTLTAGTSSAAITLALEDAFGNPVTAGSALTVSLSTTSAKGTFAPASPLTIAAGTGTVSFQYTDAAAGTPTITATVAGVGTATQQETIIPAVASQLVFTTGPQTLTAGTASGTITVALEDALGNPVAATSALTVSLTTTSGKGTFAPASPLTIAAGADTVSFEYSDTVAGTPTIAATAGYPLAGGLASATQQETINPAAASQLVFTTSPQTLTAGVASGTITVALEDAFGNPLNAGSTLNVSLTTTSSHGAFLPASSLTIPAGLGTVSFQYKDTSAGAPTLTAAAGALAPATQQETVDPAAASQLAFTTAPQTLTAGVASGTITLAIEDAFDNPVTAGSALTVSLSTTSATGTFTPASPPTIPAGEGSVSFQYSDSTAGTPTLTATAGNLTAATQKETVNPAAADQLTFVTAPQTLTAGVSSGTITITLEDSLGNPVAAASALTVSLSTTSNKGAFTPVSPLTIPAGGSTVSFRYTDASAGTPTLTATASGMASVTQQETVDPAAASQLAFTTVPQTLTAGIASDTITVALEDSFDNPVTAGGAVPVTLSTTSATGQFVPVSPLTIPAGASTVSFQYSDITAGTPTISAAAGSLESATQQETVNPAEASRLAFTTGPQTITAGTASGTITAALEDAFGNRVATGSVVTVTLSTTSGTGQFAPVSPLTIPAGSSTVSFRYTDTSAGMPVLSATGGSLTSATQQETIVPAAASHLAFTTAPQTLTAGIASNAITVALEDAFGNPIEVSSALTVSLSTTSSTGTFAPRSPVTIPAGASSVSFEYSDTSAGTPTITAAESGVTSATQQETVNPAAASRLAFTTAPQTFSAGATSGTITVTLEDSLGNRVDAASPLTVSLSTTSPTGTFTPDSPVTIPAGANTVSFEYSDTTAGTPTITAAAGSLASATQQETVKPAAASHLAFTTAAQTMTAGVASGTITVTLEDSLGNPVAASDALTVNLSSNSSTGLFSPASPLTIPAGSTAVSFHYTDTAAGTPVLTVAAGGFASATQQETVTAAAASQLVFTTAPQTLTAGVASDTITVALEDSFGNQVDAGSALTVSLSTTSATGAFSPTSPMTIPAGASTVSFQYSDTAAGTPVLAAAATEGVPGLASATQQETVNPAAASHLAFTTAPQNLTAGVESGTITIALEDSFGNTVAASSALSVALTTTSSAGTFAPASPLTILAGGSTVSFQYKDTAAGTPTITAAAGSFSLATQQETVNPAAASHLSFITSPQTLTAGVASGTITVALRDSFGNPVDATSALAVVLSTTSGKGTFAPVSPLAIPAGSSSVNFQYTDDAAGTPVLTAMAGSLSITQQESVSPAAASQLAFTTAPQTLTIGVASATMTVGLEDAFGNPVAAAAALTVSLDTTSGTGTFTPASPLTIPAGSSTVSFHYTDTTAGAPVISAASGSLSLATQQEIVNPAPASRLAFVTGPQTLTAGTPSGTITVQLEDAAGEPVDAASAVTLSLSSTSAAGTFAPESPLTVPAGANSVSFTYTDTKAGTPTLTVSNTGLGSTAQQQSVVAASASQVIFTTSPQTIVAGIASQPITVALADRYGNLTTAGSAIAIGLSSTSSHGTFVPISPLTIPPGASTTSFTYTDTSVGAPTITASASGLALGSQQFTVVAPATSSVSGYVYADVNDSGQRLASNGAYKTGIPNVTITLVPANPAVPQQTELTLADGSYKFNSLPAGTYTLVETQPPQYLGGGKDTPGNLGGEGSTSDTISQIVLGTGQKGTDYDFGEYLLAPGYLSKRLALASTPTTQSAVAQAVLSSPPVVQLGGTTVNYTTSSVGGSPVYIAPAATISHPSGNLASMTVTITDLKDGSFESLVIPGQTLGTPSQPLPLSAPLSNKIFAAYSSASGVLTLTGIDSPSDYQSVLRSIEHEDTASSPDTSPRTISVVAYDAVSASSPATATVDDPPAPAAIDKVLASAAAVKSPSTFAATVPLPKPLSAVLADAVLASVNDWWKV